MITRPSSSMSIEATPESSMILRIILPPGPGTSGILSARRCPESMRGACRHLRPGLAGAKPVDAVFEPAPIVEEHRHLAARVASGLGARHPDHAALGVKLEPVLEAALIEQPRLALKEHAALLADLEVADFQ